MANAGLYILGSLRCILFTRKTRNKREMAYHFSIENNEIVSRRGTSLQHFYQFDQWLRQPYNQKRPKSLSLLVVSDKIEKKHSFIDLEFNCNLSPFS